VTFDIYRPYRLGVQVRQLQVKYSYIHLIPARSSRGSLANTKTGPKINKQLYRKALCHNVSKLMRRRNMKNMNLSQGNILANKMNINLNMLGPSMMNWIGSHINCTDIVTIDDRSL